MTALRAEVLGYVNQISEEKLSALKPLLFMLSSEQETILERLTDSDLTDEEMEAFAKADMEFECGELCDFEEYLQGQGITS